MDNNETMRGPGGEVSGMKETRLSPEEERIKATEALQFADMEREFLARKELDPGEVWIVLGSELLYPSEKANITVSPYESGPLLKECLRRAGASSVVLALQERASELDSRIHALRNERDAQPTNTDEEKEKAREIERQMAVVARRLYGRFIQTESDGEVKTVKVEAGLLDRLNKRIEGEGLPEERGEWTKLYWKLKGSLTLLEVHNQRERYLSSYETYCEQLFTSGSYKIEMQMSEMLGILKDPVYGPGIEAALRAYVDVHMGEEVKVKTDGSYIKVREEGREEGSLGAEFVEALQKYIAAEKPTQNPDGSYDLPKPLQVRDRGVISQREIISAYAKAKATMSGNYGEGTAERAELIAKRIMEFKLLTTWLAVSRNPDGSFKGYPSGFGQGRLEGSGSTEMEKIILAGPKWGSERAKNKPAGPTTWNWSKLPMNMEGFAQDFLHTTVNVEYRDNSGKKVKGVPSKKEPTIFDLWYKGLEGGRKFKLHEIFEGINNFDQCEIERETSDGRGTEKVVVSQSTQAFPENAFDSWHFLMYKQSKCLGYVRANERGGKEDPLAQILTVEGLRGITKDAGTAFGWNPLIREWYKFNLVLSKLVAWYDTPNNKRDGEFPRSEQDLGRGSRLAQGIKPEELLMAYEAIRKSSYLPEKLRSLLEEKVDKLQRFVDFDSFSKEARKLPEEDIKILFNLRSARTADYLRRVVSFYSPIVT